MAELNMWTAEYRGLVMGAPDSPISIVRVDGLLSLPDVRSSDLTLLQRNIMHAGEDYLAGRTVTLTLEVYGRTSEEFSSALTRVQSIFSVRQGGASSIEDQFRCRFPGAFDGKTAFLHTRVRKRSTPIDLSYAYGAAMVNVEMFATNPAITADAPATASVWSVAPGSPAGTPDPVDYIRQRGSTSPALTALITGAKTPVISGVSDRGPWQLRIDDTTGMDMVYDFATRRATYANGLPMSPGAVVFTGAYPEWPPGDWPISIRHSDQTRRARVDFTWRPVWM